MAVSGGAGYEQPRRVTRRSAAAGGRRKQEMLQRRLQVRRPGVPVMPLHIVRERCSSPGQNCTMDPAVKWATLPDDLIWEVLRYLPAAKRAELQSVSTQWRRALTAAKFRDRAVEPDNEQHAVACVNVRDVCKTRRRATVQVEEIDLSFVPRSFWTPDLGYTVVAVGDGLVCISNDVDSQRTEHVSQRIEHVRPDWEQLCVVNPLTRTWQVLPEPPFNLESMLPLTATTVTIYGGTFTDWLKWKVATYDLTIGGAGGWHSAVYNAMVPRPTWERGSVPILASCGGEVYQYWLDEPRMRVLAPGPDGALVDAVGRPVDSPSVALLGLDATFFGYRIHHGGAQLVAHRGAVYFVTQLMAKLRGSDNFLDHVWEGVCGVWRLARNRLEWEPVAMLGMADVERITGLSCAEDDEGNLFDLFHAYGARELLCCRAVVNMADGRNISILLGFNLDKGEWELVHEPKGLLVLGPTPRHMATKEAKAVELRPDLFICRTGDHPY